MILTHDYLKRSMFTNVYESAGAYEQHLSDYRESIVNENHQVYAKNSGFDVFLSHSSLDHDEVLMLVHLFNQCGYAVYVDWIYDPQLNRNNVTKATAKTLRIRMDQSRGLAYLATSHATNSKWCPWELGYFDGKSQDSRCSVLPVLGYSASSYIGQEYLGLYPYLQYERYKDSDTYDFWVHDQNSSKYVVLRAWLEGADPLLH